MSGGGTPDLFKINKKGNITTRNIAKTGKSIKKRISPDIDFPPVPGAPDPAPTPDSISQAAAGAGEAERRAAKKRKGRRSLILTQQGLGDAGLGQKTSLLGA